MARYIHFIDRKDGQGKFREFDDREEALEMHRQAIQHPQTLRSYVKDFGEDDGEEGGEEGEVIADWYHQKH